jgi:hypothetical protein
MSADELNQFDAAEEELVAYLDGELEPAARGRLEQRLAREPALREKLRRTQQAWDALDLLPQTHADETFANTTMQMTVAEVVKDYESPQKKGAKRDFFPAEYWPWLKVGLGALLALCVGFRLVKAKHQTDRSKELREIRIAEQFEALSDTPSIEFLMKLRDEKLFTTKSNEDK